MLSTPHLPAKAGPRSPSSPENPPPADDGRRDWRHWKTADSATLAALKTALMEDARHGDLDAIQGLLRLMRLPAFAPTAPSAAPFHDVFARHVHRRSAPSNKSAASDSADSADSAADSAAPPALPNPAEPTFGKETAEKCAGGTADRLEWQGENPKKVVILGNRVRPRGNLVSVRVGHLGGPCPIPIAMSTASESRKTMRPSTPKPTNALPAGSDSTVTKRTAPIPPPPHSATANADDVQATIQQTTSARRKKTSARAASAAAAVEPLAVAIPVANEAGVDVLGHRHHEADHPAETFRSAATVEMPASRLPQGPLKNRVVMPGELPHAAAAPTVTHMMDAGAGGFGPTEAVPTDEADATIQSIRPTRGLATTTQATPKAPKTMAVQSGFKRYDVSHELARGGMGAIMVAKDRDLKRDVAMKVLLAPTAPIDETQTQSRISRFLEEAQITGQLEHPNIVPVHEIGLDATGQWYFTMKLVQGEALSEILHKLKQQKPGDDPYRGFSRSRLLEVFNKVCDAVAYAHSRGVVHRDLKPANVMVGAFGEVLVMDWGIAKVLDATRRDTTIATAAMAGKPTDGNPSTTATRRARSAAGTSARKTAPPTAPPTSATASGGLAPEFESVETDSTGVARTMDGQIIGTPAYMAPEQARGDIEQISERTDVYALGAMLYEILALQPPFSGRTAFEILAQVVGEAPKPPHKCDTHRDVPPELSAIAMHALQKNPRRRYPTVKAMRDDMDRFTEGHPVSVYRVGTWTRSLKWMRRNKLQTALIAAALLIAATVSIAFAVTVEEQSARMRAESDREDERQLKESAEEQRQIMAWALSELERLRLQIRSGSELPASRDALKAVLEKAPNLYPAVFELATVNDRLGDPQRATEVLQQLRDDRSAPANFRAQAAMALGVRVLNMATPEHPDSIRDLKEAAPFFRQAAALAETDTAVAAGAQVLDALGVAAMTGRLDDWMAAQRIGEATTHTYRTMWEPWYAMARIFAMPLAPELEFDRGLAQPSLAVFSATMALVSNPQMIAARRVQSRFKLDRENAIATAQLMPSAGTAIVSAQAVRLAGDAAFALKQSQQMVAKYPQNPWCWLELAESARDANELAEAESAVETALRLRPEEPSAYRIRASILMRANKDQRTVIVDIDETLRRDRTDLSAWGLKAIVFAQMGTTLNRAEHLRTAADALSRYLALRPSSAAAHDARARIRLALGAVTGAVQDWERAVQLDRRRFFTWVTMSRVSAEAHQYDVAMRYIEQAIACAPLEYTADIQRERDELETDARRAQMLASTGHRPRVTVRDYIEIGENLLQMSHGLPLSLIRELSRTTLEMDRARLVDLDVTAMAHMHNLQHLPSAVSRVDSEPEPSGASETLDAGRQHGAFSGSTTGGGNTTNPSGRRVNAHSAFPGGIQPPQRPQAPSPQASDRQNAPSADKPQSDPSGVASNPGQSNDHAPNDNEESWGDPELRRLQEEAEKTSDLNNMWRELEDERTQGLNQNQNQNQSRQNSSGEPSHGARRDFDNRNPNQNQDQPGNEGPQEWRSRRRVAATQIDGRIFSSLPILVGLGSPEPVNQAEAHQRLGVLELMIAKMQSESRSNPEALQSLAMARMLRADIYCRLGDFAKAAADCDAAARLQSPDALGAYFSAVVFVHAAGMADRPADMLSPEMCHSRALDYLELAVMKGLSAADVPNAFGFEIFAPIKDHPRFKVLKR